ncbi:hypothetical protein Q7689_11310 [Nocardiopsis tropica]|uniref:hypothetical protein n=1 Tax=Nocardiopsis tropica TaxID=109330 RepID=UPI002E8BC48D|nr:hypothetical protein [Nocardiopsis tropica]
MAHPDPRRRSQIASLAAHTSWARTPVRAERLAPANRAREQKWEQQVDPDGSMKPADRARAAASARSAYYRRLSMAGVEARRRRAAAKRPAA